jgi:hypothetical protein
MRSGWGRRSYVDLCGDQVVEQHLHNVDIINWLMGGYPVEVVASFPFIPA